MKKLISNFLAISIVTGLVYSAYIIFMLFMSNRGYIDTATGVFVSEPYVINIFDLLLLCVISPFFIGSVGTGVLSIIKDFKANKRIRIVITIIWLIILIVFNFVGARYIESILKPPTDAKEKGFQCEYADECYKTDDGVLCFYNHEEVKCPIVLVKDKIKENKDES